MVKNMANDAIRLGRLLKSARALSGLTQDQAAERVGLAPGSLSMAERGTRALGPETVGRLLSALAAAEKE